MNHFVISLLDTFSYISAVLIIVLGCLVVVAGLLYPIWFLINNVLYKRTQASIYFMSYVKNRKKFIKWHKETDPDVYTPIVPTIRKSRK